VQKTVTFVTEYHHHTTMAAGRWSSQPINWSQMKSSRKMAAQTTLGIAHHANGRDPTQ